MSNECISVPASDSKVTTGTWLDIIAKWMGRLWTQSRIFGLAPKSSNILTISMFPLALAICKQVLCLSSQQLISTFAAFNNSNTVL